MSKEMPDDESGIITLIVFLCSQKENCSRVNIFLYLKVL